MNPIATSADRHPVEQLAEDFVTRYRMGERPSLTEYTRQHPDVAEELAGIIQALLMLEDLGAAENDETPINIPERLGDFRLLREIGRGGMGIVYEAEQTELSRRVALKVLPAAALLRPTHLERFRREARAAARLHHTNIIPVYGVGSQDGIHYYAMQYIPGRSLDGLIKELREQPACPTAATRSLTQVPTPKSNGSSSHDLSYYRQVADVGCQVAGALAHAHAHGVLHRDVKPANIVIDESGTAWLGDFGLAQLADDAPLTSTGGFVGTMRYLAPERLTGDGNECGDIYSLGATLYELATLRPIFDEVDRARLLRQVAQDEPTSPRRLDHQIPQDLETIILKAIAKDPADRYPSASAMADDLQRFLADRSVTARRASRWELFRRWVKRNPLIAGLLATVLLSLSAGLATTWWQWRRAEQNLVAATKSRNDAERFAKEADQQSLRAKAHGHRAFAMLEGLVTELNTASERQPVADLRRRLMERAFKTHDDLIQTTPVDAEDRLDVAKLAFAVADMHVKLQQYTIGDTYLNRALTLIEPEASATDGHIEFRYVKARSLGQLGINCRDLAKPDQALEFMDQSMTVYRGLLTSDPGNRRYLRGLGGGLHNRGVVAGDRGRRDQAIRDFREAIALTEPLIATDADDAGMQLAVARFYHTLTNQYLKGWRYQEARESAVAGLKLADALESRSPRNQRIQELVGKSTDILAAALINLAWNAQNDDLEASRTFFREAEAPLQRAQATRQRLVELVRTDPEYHHELGNTLCLASAAALGLGRNTEAEQVAQKAIQEQTEARRLKPKHWIYTRGLSISYVTLGRVHGATGDYDKVEKLVPRIVDLNWDEKSIQHVWCAELLSFCAHTVKTNPKLSTTERKQNQERYEQRALECLRQAIRSGFCDRELLEKSPWLHALRPHADFQNLINELPMPAPSNVGSS